MRNLDNGNIRALREPKSKYYRLVQALSITFLALVSIMLVLNYTFPALTENPTLQSWVLKICLVVVAICGGGLCCLPWVYFLERSRKLQEKGEEASKKLKTTCFAFFGGIALCVLLWIIAVFVVHIDTFKMLIVKTAENATGETAEGAETGGTGALGFLTFAVLLSMQVGVASYIMASIVRYKDKHKTIRIVHYACIGLTDLWASWVAGAFFTCHLYGSDGKIMTPLNPAKFVLIIGILAFVGMLVTGSVLMSMVRKDRMRAALRGDTAALAATEEDFIQGTYASDTHEQPAPEKAPAPKDENVSDKLRELKQLLDEGIITPEEYDEKRKELLSRM